VKILLLGGPLDGSTVETGYPEWRVAAPPILHGSSGWSSCAPKQ